MLNNEDDSSVRMVLTVTTTGLRIQVNMKIAKGDPSAAPSKYELRSLSFEAHDDHFIVDGREKRLIVFGREPSLESAGDVFIMDPTKTVTHRHAYLLFRDGQLYFCDNASTNGSTINGRVLRGETMQSMMIRPDTVYSVALGKWGKSGSPVVQMRIVATQVLQTPRPLGAAELTLTFPKSQLPAQFYQIQVMSNNYLGLFKVEGAQLVHCATATQVFVGRGVDRRHMRIAQAEGTLAVGVIHGVFTARDGFLMFTDLGSVNGSFVDGERIGPNRARVLSRGAHVIGLAQSDYKVYAVRMELNVDHKIPARAALKRAA